jgi:hypothetical protein
MCWTAFLIYHYYTSLVTWWIADISEDLEEQLIGKLRNKHLSIQFDKATDCSGIGHLTAYVQYVEDTTINKDVIFC